MVNATPRPSCPRKRTWRVLYRRLVGSQERSGLVESSWNVMAHGDSREGKWRGNCRMEWLASTLHTTSEHGVSSITTNNKLMRAPRLTVDDWNDASADLNGLVRFAKRWNLVSARVPLHFERSLRKVSPLLEFDPRILQPVTNGYADYNVLAHLWQCTLENTQRFSVRCFYI